MPYSRDFKRSRQTNQSSDRKPSSHPAFCALHKLYSAWKTSEYYMHQILIVTHFKYDWCRSIEARNHASNARAYQIENNNSLRRGATITIYGATMTWFQVRVSRTLTQPRRRAQPMMTLARMTRRCDELLERGRHYKRRRRRLSRLVCVPLSWQHAMVLVWTSYALAQCHS